MNGSSKLLVHVAIHNTFTKKMSSSCPTLQYTGTDIQDSQKTDLTCNDIIQAFGPELASLAGKDADAMDCAAFQKVIESQPVKDILHIDTIPADYCSAKCCDNSTYVPTNLACIVTNQPCDTSDDMCVNGIDSSAYRCDLGRSFTYVDGSESIDANNVHTAKVVDSWTGGVYTGQLYDDGQHYGEAVSSSSAVSSSAPTFATAPYLCCTEQVKSGLE